MTFVIEKLEENKYKEWDDFCLASNEAWFWHTSSWIAYNLLYQPKSKSVNLSFMIVENGKILAICPLIVEENAGVKEFSWSGSFGPTPALKNDLVPKIKKDILKTVFEHIDELAFAHKVKRAKIKFSIQNTSFGNISGSKFNYLVKYGYLDVSINTQVLDLRKSLEDLKRGIRHGHQSDISKSSKFLTAEIYGKGSDIDEVFEKYRLLHKKAAGRETRPKATFDIMRDIAKKGEGFLVAAKQKGEYVGFAYFFDYKNSVYYGSACDDPDITGIPITHFLQWQAIQWMKKNGCNFYEVGWQVWDTGLSDFVTAKEADIGAFTRGFGGETVPLFMGEKYYNKDYFLEVYNNRLKKAYEKIK